MMTLGLKFFFHAEALVVVVVVVQHGSAIPDTATALFTGIDYTVRIAKSLSRRLFRILPRVGVRRVCFLFVRRVISPFAS